MTPLNGPPNGPEQRHEPVVAVKIWRRTYPVTPKNILTALTFITVIGGGMLWIVSRFGPLATKKDVTEAREQSKLNYEILVKNDSLMNLRLSYLERVAELASYRMCLSMRADTAITKRDNYPRDCDEIILNVRTRP